MLTAKRAIQLIPVLLAVHSAEEALTAPRSLPLFAQHLPDWVRPLVPDVTPSGFLIALAVVTIVPFIVLACCDAGRPRSAGVYALLAIQTTILLNAAFHLMAASVVGGYAPGVVTAVAVNLPYSFYVLGRAWREAWFTRPELVTLVPIAAALHGPVLLLLLQLTSD